MSLTLTKHLRLFNTPTTCLSCKNVTGACRVFPQGLRSGRGLYPHGSSGSAGEAVAAAAILTLPVMSHSWSLYCGHALAQALSTSERFTAQSTGALTVPISQMKKLTEAMTCLVLRTLVRGN